MERDMIIKLQRDHLANALRGVELREPAVQRDAVLEVNNEIAFNELGKIKQLINLCALCNHPGVERWPPLPLAAEDFSFSDNYQAGWARRAVWSGLNGEGAPAPSG
jgi:hypothetical protein